MPPIALIVTDLAHGRLGHRARLADRLAGSTVLAHTIRRAARVAQVRRVVLVHPPDQDVMALLAGEHFDKPIHAFPAEAASAAVAQTGARPDAALTRDARWAVGRKWAPAAWRGGLGGTTAFDELLPARPIAAAMHAHDAGSAVLVRGDWCLFDVDYADAQLARHLEHPEAFKLTFSQAPPGLSCLVAHRELIDRVAEHGSAIGTGLGYQPRRPQADPIGREPNHAIPHTVRDSYHRFVYDTPRSVALIRELADRLGPSLASAGALAVTDAVRALEADDPQRPYRRLPQQVTLELTPRRAVAGSITPHHHVRFDRPDMDADLAMRVVEQLADEGTAGDVALRLGGLGDALLHPQFDEVVAAAQAAGVMSVGVDTDLLVGRDACDRLLDLPIDLLTVRLNADTAETYRAVMGADAFEQVTDNLQHLFDARRERAAAGRPALPWIVPRLIKTSETLPDMERFFDRWMMVEGHAVIEPAQSGCGLAPERSPVPMAPPRRTPCRQLGGRMTILSSGAVALCDQDWLGRAAAGEVQTAPLIELWRRLAEPAAVHRAGDASSLALCGKCVEWHRP